MFSFQGAFSSTQEKHHLSCPTECSSPGTQSKPAHERATAPGRSGIVTGAGQF